MLLGLARAWLLRLFCLSFYHGIKGVAQQMGSSRRKPQLLSPEEKDESWSVVILIPGPIHASSRSMTVWKHSRQFTLKKMDFRRLIYPIIFRFTSTVWTKLNYFL